MLYNNLPCGDTHGLEHSEPLIEQRTMISKNVRFHGGGD